MTFSSENPRNDTKTRLTPTRVRVATVQLAIVLALVACQPSPPDLQALHRTVANLVTETTPRTSGKVIVFDADNLDRLPPALADALRERAFRTYHQVQVLSLNEDAKNLPGDWIDDRESLTLRRNSTHLLLLLELDGGDTNRSLRWDFLCGELCGWGESVALSWTGREWSMTTTSSRLY